jgi:hypothetical protein
MTIFRQVGNLYRRSEEVHCVQLYKGSEIAKELRQVGFRVRIIRGYGELRFRKAHVGFIATKALTPPKAYPLMQKPRQLMRQRVATP